jgi:hypothetical protein
LADAALADGRAGDAQELLRESVDLALQVQDRVGLSWYLGQLALAAALEGRIAEAGRIWRVVEAAGTFIPGGPWPRDLAALEARLRDLVGDELGHRHDGETLEELAASLAT